MLVAGEGPGEDVRRAPQLAQSPPPGKEGQETEKGMRTGKMFGEEEAVEGVPGGEAGLEGGRGGEGVPAAGQRGGDGAVRVMRGVWMRSTSGS